MHEQTTQFLSGGDHAHLFGIFRSFAGELYSVKRVSFEDLLSEQGDTLTDFTARVFGTSCFRGTAVTKSTLILELLYDQLTTKSWRFIRERLREQPFLTDRRHTEEYAFDVALGWLEEELVIQEFKRRLPQETRFERVGIDRAREFLSLNVRATADLAITSNHRRILVDLFVDHKGTWRKNGGMDLKQGKLRHFSTGRLDYVLGLDLVARRYYLVGASATVGASTFANAAMGGTETARIGLGRSMTLEAVSNRLALELSKPVKKRGKK